MRVNMPWAAAVPFLPGARTQACLPGDAYPADFGKQSSDSKGDPLTSEQIMICHSCVTMILSD
jgi:hypothetical protein